ncbi:MAG: ATP phosphoribosyltransferase [Methanothrix sp.]|uniref:ATP phosphoribosyltransferase n=1 Tax=Methanothrix thermoacetophila (strain DSM 6194 / JCM 14653 / NBRC 101360 / PT) TaxID=349307 RepID=A0B5A8_METTP|nr:MULTISPECIES: ATP phosphoribosyltransferase [Methanothrix]ABK13882.1 ATP phosphoribosyltransferase (homohexameric) [Methanothrix thermoacetophila PT]MBC7079943.1 ATP phosphoribosyltransferase [Methanothrix sp.]NPU88093.1 ATP phosphoribosyltransferase [Methanothrix sp.]
MIDIAIPKGSLLNQTLELFERAGLEVRRTEREYNARINDPRIGKVKILRPQEIPTYVSRGYFDLGISGTDWIVESGADVVTVANLNYGKQGPGVVKIVVAVPESMQITSSREIPPGSRVATEYPNITRSYFERLGIPVEVQFSYGATEAKVPELTDVVVDLTETGSTLIKNGLKIIDVILESTSELIANQQSWSDPSKREEIEAVETLLSAVIRARGKALLKMNVSESNIEQVISILPSMKHPTISKLYNSGYYAIESVVDKKDINLLIPKLKKAGASDILEIDISKIVP